MNHTTMNTIHQAKAAAEDMAQDLLIKVLALDAINAATAKSLPLTIAHRTVESHLYVSRRNVRDYMRGIVQRPPS